MKRLPYIDVLRGLAILVVFLKHLPPRFGFVFGAIQFYGGRGVDLFFVLSGFLIGTTCLIRAETSLTLAQKTKDYWLLRGTRIWPLYFLLLGLFALGIGSADPNVMAVLRHWPLPFLSFTSNFFGQSTLELGVLWSLAIEEQFYLAVSILIATCARRRDTLESAFVGLALMAIAVSLRYRFELNVQRLDHSLSEHMWIFGQYHSTLARMDQLAIGLLCAVVAPKLNLLPLMKNNRFARTGSWLAVIGAVFLIIFAGSPPVLGFTLLGVGFALAILVAQRPAVRGIELRGVEKAVTNFIGVIGKLSFGLYLLHPLVRGWMERFFVWQHLDFFGRKRAALFLLLWFCVTWALATLSYRFFENPLLSWAHRRVKSRVSPSPSGGIQTEGIRPRIEGRNHG